jgi:hypothetical protein
MYRLLQVNPDTQGDELGYPIMYVRSSAARLAPKVVDDWLLRCGTMLTTQRDKLMLKELFSHYVFQVLTPAAYPACAVRQHTYKSQGICRICHGATESAGAALQDTLNQVSVHETLAFQQHRAASALQRSP